MISKQAVKLFPLSNPVHCLAVGFGSGLFKTAPGTMGTLAAIPLFVLCSLTLPTLGVWILTGLMCVVGIAICGKSADDAKVHDHPAIVWDEFCGIFITLLAAPLSWHSVIIGFVLFRFFDIFKPWPISYLDKHCQGGFGIMIDDIVAGVFSFVMLATINYYFF